jgi:hypothetical protein
MQSSRKFRSALMSRSAEVAFPVMCSGARSGDTLQKPLAAGTWMGSSIQTRFRECLADNQQDEAVEVAIRFYG